jgi:hypothetical protein
MSKAQSKPQASKAKGLPRGATKKTTFSDREYVNQLPSEDDIAALTDDKGNVIAKYLPIDVIERDLDRWAWRTENFTYQQYRSLDKYGKPCVSASLELVIPWKDDIGRITERRLTGGCNFVISSYAPNGHFVATAKSECVKNAASDLGRKFGRGLNEEMAPVSEQVAAFEKPKAKMKPDASLLAQYKAARERGDITAMSIFENVYEINPEENATKEETGH